MTIREHLEQWGNEYGGLDELLNDISRVGLESGIVSELVYSHDLSRFFEEHEEEIAEFGERLGELGGVETLRGWDNADPFCLDVNRSLVVWAAIEDVAWQMLNEKTEATA